MALMFHKSTSTADMPAATRSGDMLDRMSDRAEDLADRAAPVLDRWASRAQDSMHHGVDAMRDASDRLRRQADHASDMTVGYIQHEPVKSVLIAAAAGAALIGIAALLARSHHA